MTLPALTVWQPWASLWVAGPKLYETRTWAPPHDLVGQWLAVHAASRWTGDLADIALSDDFVDHVMRCPGVVVGPDRPKGAKVSGVYPARVEAIPLGVVVGVVRLDRPRPTEDVDLLHVTGDDRAMGDWSPGRWAWGVSDRRVLDRPVPARGYQGLWSLDDATHAAVVAQVRGVA